MKKRNRIWLIVGIISVVLLLVTLLVVFVIGGKPSVPEVEVEKIGRGGIVATVTAEGELRARNQVDISAEIMATIDKVFIEEGDHVEKGDLLCLLDDDASISDSSLYEAQYDESKAAYERGKTMYEEGLISLADYEDLRTANEVAKAQLEKSWNTLGKTRIYAPISGQVVSVDVEAGETVVIGTTNSAGTVMFTIADLSEMQAEIYVDETDIVGVAAGQPAEVTLDALPDDEFAAEVYTIGYTPSDESYSTSGVTEFEVVLTITDTHASLRPGMSASAVITTATRESALICPLQALGEKEIDGKVTDTVFVYENGEVKLVPITTGISDGTIIEILDGISEGEIIVTGPYNTLRELNEGDEVDPISMEGELWNGNTTGNPKKGKPDMRGLGRVMRSGKK